MLGFFSRLEGPCHTGWMNHNTLLEDGKDISSLFLYFNLHHSPTLSVRQYSLKCLFFLIMFRIPQKHPSSASLPPLVGSLPQSWHPWKARCRGSWHDRYTDISKSYLLPETNARRTQRGTYRQHEIFLGLSSLLRDLLWLASTL